MKSNSGAILGLAMLAGLFTASPARTEDAAPASCDVPTHLLTAESALPKVEEAVKGGHLLDILVVGSRSSTVNAADASGYPGQLQMALREKLPSIAVNVSVEIKAKKTVAEVAADFTKLLAAKKPALIVWQTGTVDAMRSIDPDDFRSALGDGVAALQSSGVDVILMNLQYSPRTETMISVPPYLDNMRAVAQQRDVPLFDRFAIMRHWNDVGDFDLFSASHGFELAKRVHGCLGQALAKFVIEAAHLGSVQQH